MNKANIPPFYISQKVICIDPTQGLVKYKDYIVTGFIHQCDCGIAVNVNNMKSINNDTGGIICKGVKVRCTRCKMFFIDDGLQYYLPSRFAEIQQQSYPLMSFSKIVKKEKEEVLIDN